MATKATKRVPLSGLHRLLSIFLALVVLAAPLAPVQTAASSANSAGIANKSSAQCHQGSVPANDSTISVVRPDAPPCRHCTEDACLGGLLCDGCAVSVHFQSMSPQLILAQNDYSNGMIPDRLNMSKGIIPRSGLSPPD